MYFCVMQDGWRKGWPLWFPGFSNSVAERRVALKASLYSTIQAVYCVILHKQSQSSCTLEQSVANYAHNKAP
jgi:hypothetical protein